MTEQTLAKGSWSQRFLIYSLSVLLAVLAYWLIGFFLDDLDNIPGPELSSFTSPIEQSLLKHEADRLDHEISELQKEIDTVSNQQRLLKEAMTTSQNTINQLLEIQRLNATKGQTTGDALVKAFQQNTQQFLSQQQGMHDINAAITDLNLQILPLKNHRDDITKKLNVAYKQADMFYEKALEKHRLNVGILQLGLLITLLLIVVLLFLNKSSSYYRPIWIAISLAIVIKIFFVLHDCFPSQYFKYILIMSLMTVVMMVLIDLLKRRFNPTKSYMLKQFRDAYEHFFCPICEYPIRRGPMRYAFWTRRSVKKLHTPTDHSEDAVAYNCPHCGTPLYQPCHQCKKIRHSLLPYCEHCGNESVSA